jgi:hypothetical protein
MSAISDIRITGLPHFIRSKEGYLHEHERVISLIHPLSSNTDLNNYKIGVNIVDGLKRFVIGEVIKLLINLIENYDNPEICDAFVEKMIHRFINQSLGNTSFKNDINFKTMVFCVTVEFYSDATADGDFVQEFRESEKGILNIFFTNSVVNMKLTYRSILLERSYLKNNGTKTVRVYTEDSLVSTKDVPYKLISYIPVNIHYIDIIENIKEIISGRSNDNNLKSALVNNDILKHAIEDNMKEFKARLDLCDDCSVLENGDILFKDFIIKNLHLDVHEKGMADKLFLYGIYYKLDTPTRNTSSKNIFKEVDREFTLIAYMVMITMYYTNRDFVVITNNFKKTPITNVNHANLYGLICKGIETGLLGNSFPAISIIT